MPLARAMLAFLGMARAPHGLHPGEARDACLPRHGVSAAWTLSQRSPRSRSMRSALHDQVVKVRAERVPSKMQTVKFFFPSW
jgi:hypothetical protein